MRTLAKNLSLIISGVLIAIAGLCLAEDWNQPTITSAYTSVLSALSARINAAAKMDYSTATNLPTGVIRWNGSSKKFESWSGSAWSDIYPELAAHLANTSNPHSVTAAQVGAATTAALTSHTGYTSNPHSVTAAQVGALAKSSNLSDLTSTSTARTNLGVPASSTVLLKSNNLSDVADAATALGNLNGASAGNNTDIDRLSNASIISFPYELNIYGGSRLVFGVSDVTKRWKIESNGTIVPPSSLQPDYTPWPSGSGGYTVRRSLNPAVATAQQCADAVNTLWQDMINAGYLK